MESTRLSRTLARLQKSSLRSSRGWSRQRSQHAATPAGLCRERRRCSSSGPPQTRGPRVGGGSRLAVEYLCTWCIPRRPSRCALGRAGLDCPLVGSARLVPSISAQRVKLWSYPDLMGLRIIYWLRQVKEAPDGAAVPRTTTPAVRRALAQLSELDLRLWSEDTGATVRVDRASTSFRSRTLKRQTVSVLSS